MLPLPAGTAFLRRCRQQSTGHPEAKLLTGSLAAEQAIRCWTTPHVANRTAHGTLEGVSSSEPRLSRPTVGSHAELTSADANPLKSNVPLTTHILLVGIMLLFFLGATLITLQASWQWWLLPAAVAIPVIVILGQRWDRRQKAKDARRAMEAELRAAATGRQSR